MAATLQWAGELLPWLSPGRVYQLVPVPPNPKYLEQEKCLYFLRHSLLPRAFHSVGFERQSCCSLSYSLWQFVTSPFLATCRVCDMHCIVRSFVCERAHSEHFAVSNQWPKRKASYPFALIPGCRYDTASETFKLADRYNHLKPFQAPLDDGDSSQDVVLISAYQTAAVTEMVFERNMSSCSTTGKTGGALAGTYTVSALQQESGGPSEGGRRLQEAQTAGRDILHAATNHDTGSLAPDAFDVSIKEGWTVWVLWAFGSSNNPNAMHAAGARGALDLLLAPTAAQKKTSSNLGTAASSGRKLSFDLGTAEGNGRKLASSHEQTLLVQPAAPTAMPAEKTFYSCTKHQLPNDKDYHVTKVEPAIQAEHMANVHHIILYACAGDDPYPGGRKKP